MKGILTILRVSFAALATDIRHMVQAVLCNHKRGKWDGDTEQIHTAAPGSAVADDSGYGFKMETKHVRTRAWDLGCTKS